jgi:hypothetical protein
MLRLYCLNSDTECELSKTDSIDLTTCLFTYGIGRRQWVESGSHETSIER